MNFFYDDQTILQSFDASFFRLHWCNENNLYKMIYKLKEVLKKINKMQIPESGSKFWR